jgi:hypothetical protein
MTVNMLGVGVRFKFDTELLKCFIFIIRKGKYGYPACEAPFPYKIKKYRSLKLLEADIAALQKLRCLTANR